MKEFKYLIEWETAWTLEKKKGYEIYNKDGIVLYAYKFRTWWNVVDANTGLSFLDDFKSKKQAKQEIEGFMINRNHQTMLNGFQNRLNRIQTNLEYKEREMD